ncbi:MAG: BON domain-containing protein [Pyrinomonadaceae bacterium]
MKKIITFSAVAVFATALVGCSTTANTNLNANVRNANVMTNSNVAVVVDSNSNMAMNSNMASNNRYNSNMTREEYDRNRADYDKDRTGSTIGTGANDSWLWFKTRAALLATNDLRESTINVDVSNDVVTLRGTVASKAESDKAASVAKGIDGVKSVTNQLKVQAGDSMTNQMTSDGAKTANANANRR